ncbi:MAG: 30S ribosome-binding factor RbfA [Schaalia hyovaginalis]|uniref:30S ribosome-binding factor RbfA n=2 Tax=Schaalia hyovaginalis TaxID=29316 RepID=UPI0023F7E7CA|nr:30S ribosome-binding factor RbfA [Schaalia hyovaginalis]MCI7671169.1 30S ribosome-binding factor RbfA [Schaalia hyovaginalis]MDY4263435.1 30S ribosome-binding factor RbfA [Schaalia hyovaginalis]MDY4493109.1 30S ribosome-binding factor RbfA [Schaalia hyovaginalis]
MADESRRRKVQDRIQQTVASMLGRRIKDPRLGFVTITDVRVTGDLQHASIFYTVLGDDEDRKATARAFESAKGIIRSEIGKALGIRLTPSIEFLLDALPESAAAIEGALAVAKARDEEIAKLAEGARYAGDEDPYRHEDDDAEDAAEDEDEDEDEADAADEDDEETDAHEDGDR